MTKQPKPGPNWPAVAIWSVGILTGYSPAVGILAGSWRVAGLTFLGMLGLLIATLIILLVLDKDHEP